MSCCNNDYLSKNESILIVNKAREAAACAEANCGSSFTNATNAATSATNAANSATAAAASAAAAATSETNTENLWEQFNALYLGSFAVAPTTDNEGNPLQEGALYWNSVSNTMFAWDGSAWATATNFNEFTNFTSTGTTTARNLVTRTSDILNVLDFGADPTGVTNSYSAFQSAINSAITNKKSVYAPSGKYRIDSQIAVVMPKDAPDGGGWTATSTTSNTIGTGLKTFTVQSGLSISAGEPVTAWAGITGQGYMQGTVSSYSGTTLVINVTTIQGPVATYTGWDIVRNFRYTNAISSITIEGDGQDETILYFPNSDGFSFEFNSLQHTAHIRGLSITTGTLTTRTAVKFNNTYPYFGTFCAISDLTDVTFRGETGYSQGTTAWGNCVDINNVQNINFNNCLFQGSGVPSGTGINISSPGSGTFVSPITTATVFNIVNCNFTFLSIGLRYGENTQNVQISNTFFAQNNKAIFVPVNAGTLQGLTIDGCVFWQSAPGGISIETLTAIPQLIVTDNFFSVNDGSRSIVLTKSDNTIISGNVFFPDGSGNTAICAIDIIESNFGSLTLIDDNTFSSTTIGARLQDGAHGVKIGSNNSYTLGMTLFTKSGLATLITVLDGLRSRTNDYTIGYDVGAGNAVSQLTSKTTPVTLNNPCGRIITNNSLLAAGSEAAFTVNNTLVRDYDVIIANVTNGNYDIRVTDIATNSFVIRLKNNTGGPLSDAVAINFAIVRSSLT
jgi:hypothetical protein